MIVSSRRCTLLARAAIMAIGVFALSATVGRADTPSSAFELSKLFPSRVGDFQQAGAPRSVPIASTDLGKEKWISYNGKVSPLFGGESTYRSAAGGNLRLLTTGWASDAQAYASFTIWRKGVSEQGGWTDVPAVGSASLSNDRAGTVAFVKGPVFAIVTLENGKDLAPATDFARSFAATLDAGDDEIPVLMKHLPQWETAQREALYVVSPEALAFAVTKQPVLAEVGFEGGTEAVVANYGQAQLVIVEFTTPQFSIDSDQRIWTKIGELKSRNEAVPSAYRRVGNYSVFVFNAADEKSANALIDQVKYEQVVQWLGDDPHLYERLQRYFAQTSAGVLVAVLKSSGLSLLFCLLAGALIGTMLFRHRRAQRATAYSDAGGSVRLNLDQLTGPVNRRPLLAGNKNSEPDSSSS